MEGHWNWVEMLEITVWAVGSAALRGNSTGILSCPVRNTWQVKLQEPNRMPLVPAPSIQVLDMLAQVVAKFPEEVLQVRGGGGGRFI